MRPVAGARLDIAGELPEGVGSLVFSFLDVLSLCRSFAVSRQHALLAADERTWYERAVVRWRGKHRVASPAELGPLPDFRLQWPPSKEQQAKAGMLFQPDSKRHPGSPIATRVMAPEPLPSAEIDRTQTPPFVLCGWASGAAASASSSASSAAASAASPSTATELKAVPVETKRPAAGAGTAASSAASVARPRWRVRCEWKLRYEAAEIDAKRCRRAASPIAELTRVSFQENRHQGRFVRPAVEVPRRMDACEPSLASP
jgi:hypothetical protein